MLGGRRCRIRSSNDSDAGRLHDGGHTPGGQVTYRYGVYGWAKCQ